jgi:hypothetical protein
MFRVINSSKRGVRTAFNLFGGNKSAETPAAAPSAPKSDVSYIAALAAKIGPHRHATRQPIKKPTQHFDPELINNYTLPRAVSRRVKLTKNFDRFNLKPEFLPRWYLKAKQEKEEAAIAKAAASAQKAAQPKAEAPAHQKDSRHRLVLLELLKNGPKSSDALFATLGASFRSRLAFSVAMRALVRQRWARVDGRSVAGEEGKKARTEYFFSVRNAVQTCKMLGEPAPAPSKKQLKKAKAAAAASQTTAAAAEVKL